MAKKERNRRSGRKARQQKRAELEAQRAASEPKDVKASRASKSRGPKKSVKASSSDNGGFLARPRKYFSDVRTEMHRVTWPDSKELTSYSATVIAMLIVFGVAVWAVDTGFVAALVAFAGLRG